MRDEVVSFVVPTLVIRMNGWPGGSGEDGEGKGKVVLNNAG